MKVSFFKVLTGGAFVMFLTGVRSAGAGSTCPLDVDNSGPPPDVATDVVYVARTLLNLPPVPASFRVLDSSIPADSVVAANVAALCPTRLVDNGDGTISDRQTGLMWEKKTTDGSIHDWGNSYTWSASGTAPDGDVFTTFLNTLNGGATGVGNCVSADGVTQTGGFAGHCDWRLPTVGELQTILLAPCTANPCVDAIFGPTQSDFYWSSTTVQDFPDFAWGVYFDIGALGINDYGGNGYVRAVRAGS